MGYPKEATIIEVGPRDGFQFEKRIVPTELKAKIIERLAEAGLKEIQVTSFVHPKLVPQMADAEALMELLTPKEGVAYSALVLNMRGLERAIKSKVAHLEISASASETHSKKNSGLSYTRAVKEALSMIHRAKEKGVFASAGVQCAFGCVYDGKIPISRVAEIAKEYIKAGADRISISDTTGMANPLHVERMLDRILPETGDIPLVLHLHDTRGLGIANVLAALKAGVTHFDASFGGMGGCPFVKGATGNIATEETVHLMESMNIKTGVDLEKIALCAREMEDFFKREFPGKIHRMI